MGAPGICSILQFWILFETTLDILRVWDGGMAFHGGFLGVVFAVIFYCRANSIPLWSGADLIAVASPLVYSLGGLQIL